MVEEYIVKFGPHEAIAGLAWEFGKARPDGIGRTDPHLILEEISTGSKMSEAEGCFPLSLLVAELCKARSESFATGAIIWAVDVQVVSSSSGEPTAERFFVSGMLDQGVPTTDRERVFLNEDDLIANIIEILKDSDCGEVALTQSLSSLITGEFKLLELDPATLDASEVPFLEVRPPLVSSKARLGVGVVLLGVAAYWGATQWYLPKPVAQVAVEQVGLQVDHRAFLQECAAARSDGFPVPLGWEEQSSGCAYVGTNDSVASNLPITQGGLAYRQYRLVAGHDLTIAGIVADYLFEDWPGNFVLQSGSIYVARPFNVSLSPYQQISADADGGFNRRVKEAFLGTTERFQDSSGPSGDRVRFVANLTLDEAMERLSKLPPLELRLFKKQGNKVEIEVTPSARIMRPKIEGSANAYQL